MKTTASTVGAHVVVDGADVPQIYEVIDLNRFMGSRIAPVVLADNGRAVPDASGAEWVLPCFLRVVGE